MRTVGVRSIKDLDLRGKKALIRVDFNVPIKDGAIQDDTRIRASLPTIRYALEQGATVILMSHLGRPKGKPNPEYSLQPIAAHLATLLGRPVEFAEDCIGPQAKAAVEKAGAGGGVVLLENLRFHAEEEKNDSGFAQSLAELGDVYINDAFGSAHRAHASTEGIVRHVKASAAGLLMADEIAHLGRVLENPERPFVAILGGAKVSDKLEVIENLIPRVDALLIGGAMAYTFLEGAGRRGRQVAGRSRPAGRRARRRAACQGAQAAARAAGRSRGRAEARGGRAGRDARRRRRSDRRSDGARHRPGDRQDLSRGPRAGQDGHLERADGRVRDRRVRERARSRSPRRSRT